MRRLIRVLPLLVLVLLAVQYARLRLRPYPPIAAPVAFLSGDRPLVFAHRGASGERVGNTLPAFRLAARQGADVLELDVHLTSDGVVVVLHDASLERTAGVDRLVSELTFAELSGIDNGAPGLRVPALEEVFRAFPDHRINIELKTKDEGLPGALWALIEKHGRADSVLVGSTHGDALDEFRRISGGRVATSAGPGEVILFYLWFKLDVPSRPDYVALQVPATRKPPDRIAWLGWIFRDIMSPEFIRYAHRHGLKTHYWTVNETDLMRKLLEAGADGIMSDYPDRVVAVRDAFEQTNGQAD